MHTITKLLATSRNADRDRRTFFQAQVLFWMLRATDGHAKNFSIFPRPGGTYELAPLYDVLSAYPVIGTGKNQLSPFKAKRAMAVRSKNAHWTAQTPEVVRTVRALLPGRFPEHVAESILNGLQAAADKFADLS